MPRKKSKKRGRPSLSNITTSQLQAELDRRRSKLEDERSELQARLDEINEELGDSSGGRAAGRGGPKKKTRGKTRKKATNGRRKKKKSTTKKKRGRKESGGGKSLADYLANVLDGKTMSVTEATEAVQSAGYPSSSPNLRTMVNQQLLAHKGRFKRVARGQYTAK